MTAKERLKERAIATLGDISMLCKSLKENRTTERLMAMSLWYCEEMLAVNALDNGNLVKCKSHFYNCGRLDDYLITNHGERILDYGIDHLSYALLSDDINLMQRYAKLSHSAYNYMVEKGYSTTLYILQRIIAEDWEAVKWGITIMDTKSLKWKKNQALKPDRDFYEAILNKDINGATKAIYQLLKDHKKRNKYKPLINEFISTPALGYTKLAWLKGMPLEIDHPLVPKELLPFKPLDVYEVDYDFINRA
jgi:hypothetical protein